VCGTRLEIENKIWRVEKETEDDDGVRDGWRTKYEESNDEEERIGCMVVVVI
jgi:hypothetical protein